MGLYDDARLIVVLPSSDLVRAEAWYGRLGFDVAASFPTYLVLRAQDLELHLFVRSEEADGTSWSGAYLQVADVDAVFETWLASGAAVLHTPSDREHGRREFAAEDPDGNLWRVGSVLAAPPGEAGSSNEPATAEAGEAPTDGSPGTDDDAWFGIVAAGPCAGCGTDASTTAADRLGGLLLDEARRWGPVLLDADDDAVRRRPSPQRWSPLEYGAHVRDLLAVFTERAAKMLAETDPELTWWDHEAAIEDGWANESDVAAVVDDLVENADRICTLLTGLPAEAWDRTGTRRPGERFTLELLLRFAVHETVHHRVDAQTDLAGA